MVYNVKQFINRNPNFKFKLLDLPNLVHGLPSCSRSALSKFLKKNGIKTFRSVKKSLLADEIKDERILFANFVINQLNTNQLDINNFVFTDESTFNSSKVFTNFSRSVGGNYNDQNNHALYNRRKFKVNIYGILSRYNLKLVKIDGHLTREMFRQMLIDNNYFRYMQSIVPGNVVFIQDNTTLHEFDNLFEDTIYDYCENQDINILDFPRYSPEINLIENVWGYLKIKVYESVQENNVRNEMDFFNRIVQIAETKIDQQFRDNLFDSYLNRLKKVLEFNGAQINY